MRAQEENRQLEIEQVLQIARNAVRGLSIIHDRQIVHRDIKPANILLDEKGTAKIADLGLAQIPHGPSGRSLQSMPQPHPGTYGYMSPEQENSGRVLKPPSDVYALGLVLLSC